MRTGSRCEYGLCDSESMCKMCQKRGYGSGPHVADADIVPWLRLEADAAAHQPSPWRMIAAAADAIERLTAERDEARQMYCNVMTDHCEEHEARQIAQEQGWDCFKEDGK
jgi:hypothetical protein